jgi:N-formylglutamate amidohydrolase
MIGSRLSLIGAGLLATVLVGRLVMVELDRADADRHVIELQGQLSTMQAKKVAAETEVASLRAAIDANRAAVEAAATAAATAADLADRLRRQEVGRTRIIREVIDDDEMQRRADDLVYPRRVIECLYHVETCTAAGDPDRGTADADPDAG